MGAAVACEGTFRGRTLRGTALLETDFLLFRAEERLELKFSEITSVRAADGTLEIATARGTLRLALGARAARWAEKIRAPKGRVEKMGLGAGGRVQVLGVQDVDFDKELRAHGVETAGARSRGPFDAILACVADRATVGATIDRARKQLAEGGALWLIRPKGSPAISESDAREAARSLGFIDVKVVRFSAALTADKYVLRSR